MEFSVQKLLFQNSVYAEGWSMKTIYCIYNGIWEYSINPEDFAQLLRYFGRIQVYSGKLHILFLWLAHDQQDTKLTCWAMPCKDVYIA